MTQPSNEHSGIATTPLAEQSGQSGSEDLCQLSQSTDPSNQVLLEDDSRPVLNSSEAPSADDDVSTFDKLAQTIARQFGAPVDEVRRELSRLDDGLSDSFSSDRELTEAKRLGVVAEFLWNVVDAVDWDVARRWLQSAEPRVLAERIYITDYLASQEAEHRALIFSRSELAERLEGLHFFLGVEQESLLSTGHTRNIFNGSRRLWWWLSRLYPTKQTNSYWPTIEAASGYVWIRNLGEGIGTPHQACSMEEADLIPGLSAADAERLEQLRPKILSVKRAVLYAAIQELRSQNSEDFWPQYLNSIKAELTEDDFCFCLRMDQKFCEHPDRNLDQSMWSFFGYAGPCEPGGLQSILDLIRHVGVEHSIGTMQQIRDTLNDLIATRHGDHFLEVFGSGYGYFDFLGQESRETLDQAIDVFLQCEKREAEFARSFDRKVSAAVTLELDRQIVLRFRSHPSRATELSQYLLQCADSATISLNSTGLLPPRPLVQPITPPEPVTVDENVFRKVDDIWEIKYGNGAVSLFPHRDGFLYLRLLLQNPNRGYLVEALYGEKLATHRPVQPLSMLSEDQARNEFPDDGESSTGLSREHLGNPIPDARALQEYKERISKIDEQLEDTLVMDDEVAKSDLEKERNSLLTEISMATGLGGRSGQRSKRGHSVRTAVSSAIKRTISQIQKNNPEFEKHLRNSLKFLDLYSYEPETPTVWTC